MTPILPSICLGSLTAGTYLLAQLSAETKVPLGEAVGGFVFIAGLVWWLARKLQRIEDDITLIKQDLASRPCQLPGAPTICSAPREDEN